VAVMDSLRFGPISDSETPPRKNIHRNHSILEGVVGGVASYGNCFGVPNVWRRSEVRALLFWESLGERVCSRPGEAR